MSYLVNELVPLPRRLSPERPACGVVRHVNHRTFGRYAYVEVAVGREELISFEELDAAAVDHLRRLGVE